MFVPSVILVVVAVVVFMLAYLRVYREAKLHPFVSCVEVGLACLALAYVLEGLFSGDSPLWHVHG
jgi:hypothetical protein